jgi:N-carbamoyl-L-amino-acid hydrolase
VESRLQASETALANFLNVLRDEGYAIEAERLARFEPVVFSPAIVSDIEQSAQRRQITCRRMTSGAGHDAQMMARVAPAAMIFVPSRAGVSHNPAEFTEDAALIKGANVLLDVVQKLAGHAT